MAHLAVRIAFLNVGQGDSIVLTIPATREALLVDCVDADAAVDYLKGQKIRAIRGLVLTHLHADHYCEAVQFLENCTDAVPNGCDGIWLNPLPPASAMTGWFSDDHSDDSRKRRETILRSWIKWGKEHRRFYHQIDVAGGLSIQGAFKEAVELLHPFASDLLDTFGAGYNNSSLVIRVTGEASSALLTGDIEPAGWKILKNAVPPESLKASVLKMPHHGAWLNGDPSKLLADVEPEMAVISVGSNGYTDYNHPNANVLGALRERGVRVLCTQATEQCTARPLDRAESASASIKDHAMSLAEGHYHEASGCPCAGTVIVELGATALLLQPRATFHAKEIIGRFFETARCC